MQQIRSCDDETSKVALLTPPYIFNRRKKPKIVTVKMETRLDRKRFLSLCYHTELTATGHNKIWKEKTYVTAKIIVIIMMIK